MNKVTSEPYLQSFQYKITNRILNCNYNLFKWNTLDHSTCEYCPVVIDTIEHHLYYRTESKTFWVNIEKWLASTFKIKFSFTICEVIFGMLDLDVKVSHSINYILLLGKWYINSSKINKKKIFLCDFINMLKEKLQCQNQGQIMTLHTYTPNQCPYQVSTSYTLRFPRYSPDKIFTFKVTTARSKVKSRSDHDVAHLHILTNVPTKYQLPTPYSFRDIARTRFYRSRSLRQGQRSNPGQTMTLHTSTSKPMSLPRINFLHLTVSEI